MPWKFFVCGEWWEGRVSPIRGSFSLYVVFGVSCSSPASAETIHAPEIT